ncbi:molybdopterin molybdotransferase MoeA [Tundrisphaera lichenicola]|uniref:molybdopterin molybdotransferase MoeA n=1 Tax=Tundrisphaera lichenicola TaxID=2029860 RepID=UPI003EBCAAD8
MLSVDEATEAILRHCVPPRARSTPLIDAVGLTLAEEIAADIDLPPFDKALMDGYAVRSADLSSDGERALLVVEEITAGRTPSRTLGQGEASRIMTGAPLPSGADAVVMIERSRMEGDHVIVSGPIASGQFRLPQGREMKAGEVLLPRGITIDPAKVGLIASAGRAEVLAIPQPSIAILPTGDELVSASERPGPGQIRNSNGVMLASLARAWGFRHAFESPVAPDDPARLRDALGRELWMKEDRTRSAESMPGLVDVLIVSGGVSAGTKDLVPATLLDLGVEPIFHKVNVKPGKPLWFGIGPPRGYKQPTLVFGLPGNPVSGVVGFLLFVRPALDALAGRKPSPPRQISAKLDGPFSHRGDRPTYHPARLVEGRAIPLDWAGSADLRTVALADGFAVFAAGDREYLGGEDISFLPLNP